MSDSEVKLRPVDKVIGAFATGGVLAGVSAAMWFLLPILLPLLAGTAALVVGGLMLFGLLFVVSDKATRGLIGRIYRLMIQRIGLAVVRFNPIAALRDHIVQLKKRAVEFGAQRTTLHGITGGLKRTLEQTKKEEETFLAQASTAHDDGDTHEMSKLAKHAQRRKETYEYLDGQLTQLIKVEEVLGKLAGEANDVIEECEDELTQLAIRDEASAAASGALRSAMEILGDNDLLATHREAVSEIEARVGHRLAEIDMAMDKTTGLISGIDVKNKTVDKTALAAVLEYEKRKASPPPLPTVAARRAAAAAAKKQL